MEYVKFIAPALWWGDNQEYPHSKYSIKRGNVYMFPNFIDDNGNIFRFVGKIEDWPDIFKKISRARFERGKSYEDIKALDFVIDLMEAVPIDYEKDFGMYSLLDNEVIAVEIYKTLNWNGDNKK